MAVLSGDDVFVRKSRLLSSYSFGILQDETGRECPSE